MKKIVSIIVFTLILPFVVSVFCRALIEDPPKDGDIRIGVYRTETPPDTDGVIGDGEYKALHIKNSSISRIVGSETDWSRIKNTEFSAYGAVCGGTFFFAVTVPLEKDHYAVYGEPKSMWGQTSLLISLAKTGSKGREALEFGVRPDGESYVWRSFTDRDYEAGGSFAAVYENGILTYETAVPLSAFGAEEDDSFLFCFSLSLGDYYNGRQAYVQFGRGISGFSTTENADAGKDASLFPAVYILDEGETEPAIETDGPGDHEAPDTSLDVRTVSVVCAAVMALSLAGAGFIKLKIKN